MIVQSFFVNRIELKWLKSYVRWLYKNKNKVESKDFIFKVDSL